MKKKQKTGNQLKLNVKFQNRQIKSVLDLYDQMAKDVQKTLEPLIKTKKAEKLTENTATDAGVAVTVTAAIAKLTRKWDKIFSKFAVDFTSKSDDNAKRTTASSINSTIKQAGGAMTIKAESMSQRTRDILRVASVESVEQIKTISSNYMKSASSAMNYSITQNSSSLEELQGFFNDSLKSQYKTHRNKAKNLALEQTANIYTALSTQRMRDVGMNLYVWRHANGSNEPRHYHKYELNGQTFDINDPPVIDKKTGKKGNPGDDFFCRCYKVLVVNFGQFE